MAEKATTPPKTVPIRQVAPTSLEEAIRRLKSAEDSRKWSMRALKKLEARVKRMERHFTELSEDFDDLTDEIGEINQEMGPPY